MKLFNLRKPTNQQIDTFSIPASSQARSINLKQSSCGEKDQQSNNKIFFQKLIKKSGVEESEANERSQNSIPQTVKINSFSSHIVQNYVELKNFLQLNNSSYSLRLAYRASQQDFDVSKFHKLCKNLSQTIILAEVKDGNIVGGYSPLSWQDNYQQVGTYFKTDKTQQSFIFNYTSKQKYNLIKISNNKAIVGSNYLGPTFGGGYDFSIGNFANKKYSSICNFPTSYSKISDQLRIIKLNRKSLIGLKQHQESFLIKEWQVFEICFHSKIDEQGIISLNKNQKHKIQTLKKQPEQKYWSRVRSVFLNKKQKKSTQFKLMELFK